MIDLGLIIAIIGSTFTIIASMFALFLWVRTEANADRRQIANERSGDRKEIADILKEIKDETIEFHKKIYILEERFLQIKEKELNRN